MSAYKKGGEPYLRPYHAIIRAKMGCQRDNVPLAGGVGDCVPHKLYDSSPSFGRISLSRNVQK